MTKSSVGRLKGCVGCGMFLALIGGSLGAPDSVQHTLLAFGFVWGYLWVSNP